MVSRKHQGFRVLMGDILRLVLKEERLGVELIWWERERRERG